MKTHRIILPAAQHEAALRGVDRLLLPMRLQPTREFDGFHWCARIVGAPRNQTLPFPGMAREVKPDCRTWDMCHKVTGCLARPRSPYVPGDRLALLEPWMRRFPLTYYTCFYRVLTAEPVRECDAWAWAVKVEKEGAK